MNRWITTENILFAVSGLFGIIGMVLMAYAVAAVAPWAGALSGLSIVAAMSLAYIAGSMS